MNNFGEKKQFCTIFQYKKSKILKLTINIKYTTMCISFWIVLISNKFCFFFAKQESYSIWRNIVQKLLQDCFWFRLDIMTYLVKLFFFMMSRISLKKKKDFSLICSNANLKKSFIWWQLMLVFWKFPTNWIKKKKMRI